MGAHLLPRRVLRAALWCFLTSGGSPSAWRLLVLPVDCVRDGNFSSVGTHMRLGRAAPPTAWIRSQPLWRSMIVLSAT